MTDKTIEALKLAEEALNAMLTHMGMDEDEWTKPTFNQARQALTAIREALTEQTEQEPLMDYERVNALREGEQNGAEDAYFFVRPENDTPSLRKMFCQGFERGFHKGLKYASHVRTKDLTDDEVHELVLTWENHALARAVIAADRRKNK